MIDRRRDRTEPPRSVDGRGLDRAAAAAIRRMAVRRVAQGERPSDVMRRLGLCRTTIYRWLRAADRGGAAALDARPHRGKAPRVPIDRAALLHEWIVGRAPSDHGVDGAMWTREAVCRLVRARLGVTLHPVSASRLLSRFGLRPSGRDLPVTEAAGTPGASLAFAVDGRGAFLCARLDPSAVYEARLRALRSLAQRAGRPTSFRVATDPDPSRPKP